MDDPREAHCSGSRARRDHEYKRKYAGEITLNGPVDLVRKETRMRDSREERTGANTDIRLVKRGEIVEKGTAVR